MTLEESLLKLRLQVLSLGEKHKWWTSSFFTEESISFLEYVFPKTTYATSVIAASEVGKEIHDKAVGTGKFHLFRLPQGLEEKIHRFVLENEALPALLKSTQENELDGLEAMTEYIAIHNEQGPIHIGTVSDVQEEGMIQVLAKHYYEAFNNNYQTFPYLK
jgi:hypothetical protein